MKYSNSITWENTKLSRHQSQQLIQKSIPEELRNGLSPSLKSRLQSIALSHPRQLNIAFMLGCIDELEKLCSKGIKSHRRLKEALMYLTEFDPSMVKESPWLE